MQFRYGQRVKCLYAVDGNTWIIGRVGTVVDTKRREHKPGIMFDGWDEAPHQHRLHSLRDDSTGNVIPDDVGWYCPINALILVKNHSPIGVDELI